MTIVALQMPHQQAKERLRTELERLSGKRLALRINDNRSTVLSVRKAQECLRVSIHRIFLEAPKNIMEFLACYIAGDHQQVAPQVRAFIEEQLRTIDYSALLNKKRLNAKGKHYDLHALMGELNRDYFFGELHLAITWFGRLGLSTRRNMTFGLYEPALKLVKVHRLLDSIRVPDYVVQFVIYHEMLHHVCPSFVDEAGRHQIHHKEFRERERAFTHYEQAQSWIEQHWRSLHEEL